VLLIVKSCPELSYQLYYAQPNRPTRSSTEFVNIGDSMKWNDDGLDEQDHEINERKMILDEILQLAKRKKVVRKEE
jgi:hypothetical protein